MSSTRTVKLSLGGGDIGSPKINGTKVAEYLETYRKHGHTEIDAAALYPVNSFGQCEKELSSAGPWAVVSTKIVPPLDQENVKKSIDASLERLGRSDVDILYLHFPDAATPLEETLAAIDAAYRDGKFKRFGLSNLTPEMIEKFIAISEEKGEG